MATQDTLPQEGALRRIRSAGDIPSRPERAHLRSNRGISEATGDHQAGHSRQAYSNLASPTGQHQSPSSAPSTPANISSWSPSSSQTRPISSLQPPQGTSPSTDQQSTRAEAIPRNIPLYVRLMMYFGIGRNASYARKSLVSLIWNISWGFLQVVVIMTMLILTGTHFRTPSDLSLSEWTACDRPLGVWASLWIVRVILASSLAYWDFLRERVLHSLRADAEANINRNVQRPLMAANRPEIATTTTNENDATNNSTPIAARPTESPNLSYSRAYSRLTLISSLMTLSWFLTAHILEYTSISTCRHTSPHLWWLVFGILCIMYLMVLEVVLLGLIVLVIAPIIFIFWNIFLICIGRHPMQNPHMIKPEIGKLPKSVVERIPLVMYIPPPPESEMVTSPHSYPPKIAHTTSKPTQRRFKLLHDFSSFRSKKSSEEVDHTNEKKDEILSNIQEPVSWEDNWEQNEYPFVALEGNRAACAICLMDFEEPKRKNAAARQGSENQAIVSEGKDSTDSVLPPNVAEEQRGDSLKLEDAGEGAQPLRLLQCGHVFHKTCLDPWLIDVSGRCPVCQRPVEIPKSKKSRRTP